MRPLYLIDYSNFLYRFVSALKSTRTMNGVTYNMSSVHGFIRCLKSNPFKDIMICLDGYPKQSCTYLPSYKGHRSKEPNEGITFPKNELIRMLTVLGPMIGKNIKVVCSPNQEADQVIASIVHQVMGIPSVMEIKMQNLLREPISNDHIMSRVVGDAELIDIDLSPYDTVIVASTDSDMYQLLEFDSVLMDSSTGGKVLNSGEHTPKAVHHMLPSLIPVYKAISGDDSDNVPALIHKFTQDNLIKFLAKNIPTKEELHKFIKNTILDLPQSSKEAQEFADYLKSTNQISQLSINNKVTELMFVSTPRQLVYSTYSIKPTIIKYNIKI